jgi:hypothetical protein
MFRTVEGEMAKMYLSQLPTNSLWFERFALGCLRRMGQDVRLDWAITLQAMHGLIDNLEEEWSIVKGWEQRRNVAVAGAFALLAFGGSFRGNKVFLTDLYGLRKYLVELHDKDLVIVSLLGKYKGEIHHRYHLTPMAGTTNSGLQIRLWLERLVSVQQEKGLTRGAAFSDVNGHILSPRFVKGLIAERLQQVKETTGLIPVDVDCFENFGISRSFRRGATSTARARGVNGQLIDLINRWRKFEEAKGQRPRLAMQDHYSDIEILIPELIKFSQAL